MAHDVQHPRALLTAWKSFTPVLVVGSCDLRQNRWRDQQCLSARNAKSDSICSIPRWAMIEGARGRRCRRYLCKWFFFLTAFPWPSGLKRRLLVIFGAEVGNGLT